MKWVVSFSNLGPCGPRRELMLRAGRCAGAARAHAEEQQQGRARYGEAAPSYTSGRADLLDGRYCSLSRERDVVFLTSCLGFVRTR